MRHETEDRIPGDRRRETVDVRHERGGKKQESKIVDLRQKK